MRKVKSSILFIFIILILTSIWVQAVVVAAEAVEVEDIEVIPTDQKLFFSHDDPANDDYGPGTYQYPTNQIFQTGQRLFDILSLKITSEAQLYHFYFQFADLSDPWNSRYGFSLPMLEIYLDHLPEQGINNLFSQGANVAFPEDFKWDKLIKLSGWWVKLYRPEDRGKDLFTLDEEVTEDPYLFKEAKIKVENNMIMMTIPKKITGSLENAKMILLVGSFDPFGYDHFRDVDSEKSSWKLSDLTVDNADSLTRVLDIMVAARKDQTKVLAASENGEYPVIPYLYLNETKAPYQRVSGLSRYLMYFVAIIFIIMLFFIIKKFKYHH